MAWEKSTIALIREVKSATTHPQIDTQPACAHVYMWCTCGAHVVHMWCTVVEGSGSGDFPQSYWRMDVAHKIVKPYGGYVINHTLSIIQ